MLLALYFIAYLLITDFRVQRIALHFYSFCPLLLSNVSLVFHLVI